MCLFIPFLIVLQLIFLKVQWKKDNVTGENPSLIVCIRTGLKKPVMSPGINFVMIYFLLKVVYFRSWELLEFLSDNYTRLIFETKKTRYPFFKIRESISIPFLSFIFFIKEKEKKSVFATYLFWIKEMKFISLVCVLKSKKMVFLYSFFWLSFLMVLYCSFTIYTLPCGLK
jgi:hypothetical protein